MHFVRVHQYKIITASKVWKRVKHNSKVDYHARYAICHYISWQITAKPRARCLSYMNAIINFIQWDNRSAKSISYLVPKSILLALINGMSLSVRSCVLHISLTLVVQLHTQLATSRHDPEAKCDENIVNHWMSISHIIPIRDACTFKQLTLVSGYV